MKELEDLYLKQQALKELRKKEHDLEEEIECELAGVLSKGITVEGDYTLKETMRKKNEIDYLQFKQKFPNLVDKSVSVVKKKAEAELKGIYKLKNVDAFLEDLYKTTTTKSYFVDKKL
jgi:Neuraminidase (sialidase)